MTARAACVAIAGLLAAAATPARAEELAVRMPARVFEPGDLTAVVGDTVRWTNTSGEDHEVLDLPLMDSGRIPPGGGFAFRFDQVGPVPYVCQIHPFMRGQVTVVAATLTAPPGPLPRGDQAQLRGRVPAGTTSAALVADDGGWMPLAVDARGGFAVTVSPESTTSYVVRTPGGDSPAIRIAVVERARVSLRVRHGRSGSAVHVAVAPVPRRGRLLLQLYSRERFAWRTVAHARPRAHWTIRLRTGVRRRVRVVLLDARGALVARSPERLTHRPRQTNQSHRREPQHHVH